MSDLKKYFSVRLEKVHRTRSDSYIPLAFLFGIAALLRSLPELSTGIYATGYDTTSGYILDASSSMVLGPSQFLETPLMSWLLWTAHVLCSVNVFFEIKIATPLVYGLFVASFYYMVQKGLDWSRKRAFIATFVFLFEPVVLRIGWDLLREEVALSFFFLLIALTRGRLLNSKRPRVVLILGFLILLTEQLVAVLLIVTLSWELFSHIKDKSLQLKSLINVAPLFFFFVAILGSYHFTALSQSLPSITVTNGTNGPQILGLNLPTMAPNSFFVNYYLNDPRFFSASYQVVMSYVGSLSMYTVLPLVPLALWGFFKNRAFTPITLFLLIAGYSILLSPSFAVNYYWRWIILLPIPLTLYAINGASKLASRINPASTRTITLILLIALVALGLLYSTSTLLPINREAQTYIPASLSATAIPLSEISYANELVRYVNANLSIGAYVLSSPNYAGVLDAGMKHGLNLAIVENLTLATASQLAVSLNSTSLVYVFATSNLSSPQFFTLVRSGPLSLYMYSG